MITEEPKVKQVKFNEEMNEVNNERSLELEESGFP